VGVEQRFAFRAQAMCAFQIEATDRWDALALAAKLTRYSWYLVELGERRWSVCVRLVDKPGTDVPSDLGRAIDESCLCR
jgi:hypothetical protein